MADIASVMKTKPQGLKFGLGLALIILLADQLSKWWILTQVMAPPRAIEVTPFFNLVLAWNRGVSFGLFNDQGPAAPWILSGVALAVVAALVWWLMSVHRKLPVAALGLVIGGAIGNVIDRLRFGAVSDFLDFHVAGYHWPAFNLADSAITVGVALLIFDGLFVEQKSTR